MLNSTLNNMNINLRLRNIFYITIGLLLVWLVYLERQILSPFIIAMIFAYIFNPLINFFSKYLKFSRTISIVLVYLLLIGSGILVVNLFIRTLLSESTSISSHIDSFFVSLRHDIKTVPDWLQPVILDYISYFNKNPLFDKFTTPSMPFVSRAFFGFLNVFIFLFSAFFFLRDGRRMIERLLLAVPNEYRIDATVLLRKINTVLASYLRGQFILIISMVIMMSVSFFILGVRYAITISLFTAVFEIVPILGPIVAAVFGIFIIMTTGGITNYDLTVFQSMLVLVIIFYVTRQIQDYLLQPYVIGKATKLHPLIILFSVLAGEQIYGILGVLLAVPFAAILKIVIQTILDKIYEKDIEKPPPSPHELIA